LKAGRIQREERSVSQSREEEREKGEWGIEWTDGLTPPEVGAAEASSAMDMPTNKMNTLATNHYRNKDVNQPL
jgi:hypothetical protein